MPLPVRSGRVTAIFGPTDEPLDSGGINKGVDFAVPVGTEVEIVEGGTVIQAGPGDDGWGISVKIRDKDGIVHNYGHMSATAVKVGQTVTAGGIAGLSGNSGASTGPHVSYDVLGPDGRALDPSPYLGFNAVGDNRASSLIGTDVEKLTSGGDSTVEDTAYWEKRRRFNQLTSQYGLWLDNPDLARQLKIPQPAPEIVQEMLGLDAELADYEETYQAGRSPSEIRTAYDFWNSTDPRAIDAENAATKYAAEVRKRQDAAAMAGDLLTDQTNRYKEATDSQEKFIDSAAGGGPRMAGAVALPAKLKSGEELFAESLKRVGEGLPDLPGIPYPSRPNSLESILGGGNKRPAAPAPVLRPGVAYGGGAGGQRNGGFIENAEGTVVNEPDRRPTSSAVGGSTTIPGSIMTPTVDVTLGRRPKSSSPFGNIRGLSGLSDIARSRWQTSNSR